MSIKSFSEAQAQAAYNAELNAPAALIDAWTEILPLQAGTKLNSGGSITDFDIGSGYHGPATNMGKIFMPLQYIPMCITENYHNFDPRFVDIMIKYVAGFVLAHEIGHNNIHPGQSAGDWASAIKDIEVDESDKVMWMNFISDIMVNYNVNNATALSGGVSADRQRKLYSKHYFRKSCIHVFKNSTQSCPYARSFRCQKNLYRSSYFR